MRRRRLEPAPADRPLGIGLGAGLLVAGLLVLCGTWVLVSELVFVVPSLPDTASTIASNLTDADYLRDLAATARNAAIGTIVGTGLGLLIGIGLGRSSFARSAFEPLILSLYALPKVLLYPLMIPALGIAGPSKVFMGALFAVFPMIIIVSSAVAGAPPVFFKLARSLQASRWQVITRVILPAVRVPIVTGVRIGLSLAVLGVILSEIFASQHGVGQTIRRNYEVGDYAELFATVVIVTGGAAISTVALWRLERRLSSGDSGRPGSTNERRWW